MDKRLTFKTIKKGMKFKASGKGRQPDERIFTVSRKQTKKPSKNIVWIDTVTSFTKDEFERRDPGGPIGCIELDFTMSQVHRFLTPIVGDSQGFFI